MPDSAMHRQFMEMLDAHGPALMAMLRRLCGSRHDAEDIFQDTAIRIWRGFASRPRLRNPRGWIMTIGYRAFLDARERKRGHEDLQDPPDDRNRPAEQAAEHSEACGKVNAAIAELSEPIREVVVCHYLGGLTLSQTASAMKLSQGTVKSRLSAALSKLRSVLE
ncbi:MAG: polymerase subunit sigma [Phycisphaerales bacterium]|nr:polymerase subunit sigma [Phycisphaerales bacterium]